MWASSVVTTLVRDIQGRCASNWRQSRQSKPSGRRQRNESGKRSWEIMMHELSMGKLRSGIILHTTVPYHPTSNGVSERMVGYSTMPCAPAKVGSKLGTVEFAFLVQRITSPFRARARGKIKSRVKTRSMHQNMFAASVSANGPKLGWCPGLRLVVSGKMER